jgi:glucose/arabinose dehydrogenase
MMSAVMLRRSCGLALLAAWLVVAPASAQTTVDLDLTVDTIVTGLDRPTTMAFVGADDILFLEKDTGRVRRVLGGVLQATVALDVDVATASERGLLGIAVNTELPPGVFLFFTEATSQGGTAIANRVYRYDWNAGSGTLDNPLLVLDLPVLPGSNHDGGVLVLGPPGEGPAVGDGSFLYAAIGDLNRNNQLENFPAGAAPDDTAVVLRVLQDGTAAPGNPFTPYCSATTTTTCSDDLDCPISETCTTEVARYWAYGVRNCFGMSLDPETGSLWDTENGPAVFDEINLLPSGANSGWEPLMGPDTAGPPGVGDLFDMPGAGSTYSDPEFSFASTIAPTGIAFPTGSSLGPAYDDVVLVGVFNLGQIFAFPLNPARDAFDLSGFTGVSDLVANSASERDQFLFGSGFGSFFGGITDLEMGPDGALYVVSIGNSGSSNGAIWRISGPRSLPALNAGAQAALAIGLLAATALLYRSRVASA